MNKVILIGHLTKDPELKFLPGDGKAVARFTLAVNRQFKKEESDFISCTVWGKAAETITQYCVKGSKIAVTGSIRTGSYEDKAGNKKYTTDVNVESFEFAGGKSNASGNNNFNSYNNDSSDNAFGGCSSFGGPDEITQVEDDGSLPF